MAARRWEGVAYRGTEATGGTRAIAVAPIGLGAEEKHRVPRAWPWCDETKIMARERRATGGVGWRMGVPGLTRTGVRGERRADARGYNPWGA